MAISHCIRTDDLDPVEVYGKILVWAEELKVEAPLMDAIRDAELSPPADLLQIMSLKWAGC
jgi:hypothetical protein